MFKMLAQLWTTLEVFFGAFEKTAKALDHIATVGEEKAAAFLDEARINRQKDLLRLQRELSATQAE